MTTLAANSSGRKSTKDKKLNPGKSLPNPNQNNVNEIINNQPEEFKTKSDKFQPTAEQMRIASLMNDKKDENDLKPKIEQIVELTGASREDAAVALYDCDNDMTKAIEMILDGEALDSEWQSTGRKKKTKPQTTNQSTVEVLTNGNKKAEKSRFNQKNATASNSSAPNAKSQRGGSVSNKNRKKDVNRTNDVKNEIPEDNDVFSDAVTPSGDFNKRGAKRGGPRMRGARGKGPGAGRGSRTFMNRGLQNNTDAFPNSIDTWTNSAAEHAKLNDDINTMTVGNWSDIATNEEWTEEDWTTAHMETKVFTPSTKVMPEKDEVLSEPNKALNHNTSTASMPTYMSNKNEGNSQPTMSAILTGNIKRTSPATAGQALLQQIQQQSSASQNSNLNQYSLSQYSKQATESIKSLVGLSSNNIISGDMMSSNEHSLDNNLSQASKQSSQTSNQNRMKVQNTRTSKIPDSAVEMPSNDPIKNLELHFGSLEFGNNSFPLSSADSNIFDAVNQNSSKKVDKSILPQSNNSTSSNSNFRTANSNNANNNKPILQNPVIPQSLNDSLLNADHRNEKSLNSNHYNPGKPTLDRKTNDYMSYKPYSGNDNSYSAYPSTTNVAYYSNTNQAIPFGMSTSVVTQSLIGNNVYSSTYNANNKIRDMDNSVQQVAISSVSASKPYDATTTVGASLSLMSNSTVTTNVLKNTLSASKGIHGAPPGVQPTQVLSTPYLVSNTAAGLPIPYPYSPYDVQFQTNPRDHGYSSYAAADVKYNRGNESEMLPVSSQSAGAVQTATQAHNQAYVNAYPPGYGYFFGLNFAQSLYGPTQHALYPVAQTTASAGSTFPKANTAANYGSHSYNSGYDSLGAPQTQDFVNKSYPQQIQQHKQMSGASGNDLSVNNQQSMYNKTHSQLNKSYDKQNFQSQAQPFNMSNTAQSAANLSSAYGNAYMLPHQQMHHSLATAEPTQPGVGSQRSMSQTHKGSGSNTGTGYGKFNWN